MNFNYQLILSQLSALLLGVYTERWPVVTEAALNYFKDAEERLTNLANDYIERKDKEFLNNRLAEEKFLLWSQIRSFEVLAEATAEKLANDAVAIVMEIINGLIPKEGN